MLDLSFKRVAKNVYVKWNAAMGIRTTVTFPENINGKVHVKREQKIDFVLDENVKAQNDFTGYKGKELVQVTRIPIVEHQKLMEKCGFKQGQGYDVKKWKSIVNDSDYRKFKMIPGKV